MFSKKIAYSILILCTVGSGLANAQMAVGTTDSKSSTRVDMTAMKEADVARKQQLLAQSTKLQALYTQNIEMIIKTETSLAEAKARCLEVCTKAQMYGVIQDVKYLSAATGGAMLVANTLRLIAGNSLVHDEWVQRGADSFTRPLKTVAGRMMLGSGLLLIGSSMLQDFIDNRDAYTKSQISAFEADLASYKQNLAQTQQNIDVTNAALAQSLKIEQTAIVKEKTSVGYSN